MVNLSKGWVAVALSRIRKSLIGQSALHASAGHLAAIGIDESKTLTRPVSSRILRFTTMAIW